MHGAWNRPCNSAHPQARVWAAGCSRAAKPQSHDALRRPPLVEGRRRDIVPAAELGELRARFVLPDDRDDLLVGEPARAYLSSP
jgi:hypothetical protein